ncbi:hypothetical protein [Ornithinimicrobium tianjinense]|uniref:LPXTG-motif cell wall anchor domain-containing protein n=1 Tax=Ornithinimicrobium tianjinense TaxID=1195761 RepID=A0A917BPT2_9MICO|nr:hypothetical protein [Ornithinimicrobium tianjinense]GGF54285.1 hypothetical protein GCM10011366_22690 [Ornithinimicrobium tianjinense]
MTTFRRGAAALAAGLMMLAGAGTAAAQTIASDTNDPQFWADLLMDPEGDFGELGLTEVECFKVEPATAYTEFGTYENVDMDGDGVLEWVFTTDDPWLAVVLKAGAAASVEEENALALFVEPGESLAHESGKEISHLILCDGLVPDDAPVDEEPVDEEPVDEEPVDEEPTTPGGEGDDAGTPIGPVVQTDRPVQGPDPYVVTGLAAMALAGAAVVVAGARRRAAARS